MRLGFISEFSLKAIINSVASILCTQKLGIIPENINYIEIDFDFPDKVFQIDYES